MFQGTVSKVFSRDNKWGKMYSFKIDSEEQWFNTGKKTPPPEGSFVSFNSEPNAKGYWDVDPATIKIKKDEAPMTAPKAARLIGMSNLSKDDYWRRKEDRDLLNDKLRNIGAARNTAIEYVRLLIDKEALKIPAKAADKEAAIKAAVDHYTLEFMRGTDPGTPENAEVEGSDEPADEPTTTEEWQ